MPTLTLRLDGYKALPQGSKNAYIHRYTGKIVQVESVKGLKTARQITQRNTGLRSKATRLGKTRQLNTSIHRNDVLL
jgi:hypothetical protein